jgi:iron(III) transport system substrate-binding protein
MTIYRLRPARLNMKFAQMALATTLSCATTSLTGTAQAAPASEVNIYSLREPALIEPLLKAFEARTGIKANIVFAKDGLIERLSAEGRNSPADVLLTNEFALLLQAKEAGVTRAVTSPKLQAAIPPELRDPDGHWFGLTRRARVIYASKDRVKTDTLTYEQLADPEWKGRICIRSGQYTYNTSLIASLIAHKGEAWTETWLKGLKANLAKKPSGGDRDQAKFVFEGKCDIGIGNTYYIGAMATNDRKPEEKQWVASIKVIFPNASDRGTHVNISGAAVTAHAPHAAQAQQLLEFLAEREAQQLYASANNEYPARADVAASPTVASWGGLKADAMPLATWARFRKKASELVDKVGFDDGPGT